MCDYSLVCLALNRKGFNSFESEVCAVPSFGTLSVINDIKEQNSLH